MANLDDGEFAARAWLLSLSEVTALVSDRVYFEVPNPADPSMPCVENPLSSVTSNGKYSTVRCNFVTYGASKFVSAQVAMAIGAAMSDENAYPVDVGNGYRVIGAGEAVVAPINGSTAIKRYSVTGFLEIYKEEG